MMTSKDKKGLKCSACVAGGVADEVNESPPFTTTDQLWAHISTVHLSFHPFECVFCPMVFMPSEGVLNQHYEHFHPRKTPKRGIYTYDERKKTEIREIFLASQKLSILAHNEAIEESNDLQPGIFRTATDEKLKSPSAQSSSKAVAELNSVAQPQQKKAPCDNNRSELVSWEEDNKEANKTITAKPRKKQSVDIPIAVAAVRSKEKCYNKKQRQEIAPNCVNTSEIIGQSFTEEFYCSDRSGSDVEIWEEEDEVALEVEKDKKRLNEQMESDLAGSNTLFSDCRPKSVNSNSERTKELIVCQLCNEEVRKRKYRTMEHIWVRHTSGFRYSCNVCDKRCKRLDNIKNHVAVKHKEEGSAVCWTNHTLEMMPEFTKQYDIAFEKFQRKTPKRSTFSRVANADCICTLCGYTVALGSRMYHVWRYHMSKEKYTCGHCDVGLSTVAEMKRHQRAAKHGNADCETSWIDNTLTLHAEYARKVTAAFGVYRSTELPPSTGQPFITVLS